MRRLPAASKPSVRNWPTARRRSGCAPAATTRPMETSIRCVCARKSNTSCSARRSSRWYSRLIGADEEGTLGHLRALCREFANPKIKEQRGCVVKTAGDGLLVKSASVIGAVGLSRRRHGREESVIKLTLGAGRKPYDAYGLNREFRNGRQLQSYPLDAYPGSTRFSSRGPPLS